MLKRGSPAEPPKAFRPRFAGVAKAQGRFSRYKGAFMGILKNLKTQAVNLFTYFPYTNPQLQ